MRATGWAGMRASRRARRLPPSLRGGAVFVRHREAAKRPKQSRREVPRIPRGRRTVWPCPILDCFALASLALAMTWGGGAASHGRAAYRVAAPLLDCFALASLALAMTGPIVARARNDGGQLSRARAMTAGAGPRRAREAGARPDRPDRPRPASCGGSA